MFIIGLTGGIASGKSTVTMILKQLGIPVCDTDELARIVVEKHSEGLAQLVATFTEIILTPEKTLDRQKLSALIFDDPQKRQQVNSILHPLIFQKVNQWLDEQEAMQADMVVVDVPLLYEVGYDKQVDAVLVVAVDETCQKERLMLRNQLSEQEADARLKAQLPLSSKVKRADFVVDNNGTLQETIQQVQTLVETIKTMLNA